MRLSSLWSEAVRNLATGTSRLLAAAAVLGAALAGLTVVDARAVVSLVEEAQTYRAAGAAISTLSMQGRVDGGTCEALVTLPDAEHAGAMRRATTDLVALTMPSSPLPTYEVTPGFAALLTGSDLPSGLLVSDTVADQLGISTGSHLQTSTGTAPVDAIYRYPDDGRRSGLGYAVLVVTESDGYDECWLSQWPQSSDSTGLLSTVLTPVDTTSGQGDVPVLAQLNTRLGAQMDGAGRFDDRPTSVVTLLALGFGCLVGAGLIVLRRLELASARHSGVSRGTQLVQMLVETLVIAMAAIVLASAPMIIVIAGAPVGTSSTLTALGARTAALGAVGLLVGAAVGVSQIRERHLFRYFADR